jgi:hypothetical protein
MAAARNTSRMSPLALADSGSCENKIWGRINRCIDIKIYVMSTLRNERAIITGSKTKDESNYKHN